MKEAQGGGSFRKEERSGKRVDKIWPHALVELSSFLSHVVNGFSFTRRHSKWGMRDGRGAMVIERDGAVS